MRLPNTTPPTWPEIKPGRFAAIIRHDPTNCRLALLGLPHDLGIKLNNGRPGAAQGPAAFRAALATFGTTWDGQKKKPLNVPIFDAGDITPTQGDNESALLDTHTKIESAVAQLHQLNLVPICIGGGHDLTLPTITALSKHTRAPLAGINFDAHLDVRPRPGSGMAFRKLIDEKFLDPRRFTTVGVGRFVNDEPDCAWLTTQGASLIYADDFLAEPLRVDREFAATFADSTPGFLSIDLDAIDSSAAPGVSATNPAGLTVRHAAAFAEHAGLNPNVRHFDIMELSPPHDPTGRTARVAAVLFLSFVAGFGVRPQ
jgi:formiminoglutamase